MKSSDKISVLSSEDDKYDLTFTSVFDNNYSGLVFFSYNIIKDKDEAEDIVQNAFVSYWKCKDDLGSEPNVIKGFLYTTVRNLCFNLLKHRLVVQKFRSQLEEDPIEENYFEREIIRSEVLSEIFIAIDELPPRCSQVLKMSYLEGKKNQEISEMLGVSINTVKTQKQRALQLLRLKLSPTASLLFLLLFPN